MPDQLVLTWKASFRNFFGWFAFHSPEITYAKNSVLLVEWKTKETFCFAKFYQPYNYVNQLLLLRFVKNKIHLITLYYSNKLTTYSKVIFRNWQIETFWLVLSWSGFCHTDHFCGNRHKPLFWIGLYYHDLRPPKFPRTILHDSVSNTF